MIEVLVSIAVLSIGLMGVAMLVGSTVATGNKAKYMSMANVLASEKLDDLNKLPFYDPNVAPNPGGSLTGPPACAAGDHYCDEVTVNEASGADYETQTQIVTVNGNPTLTTTTIVHTNTGCVGTPADCGVANPSGGGGSTFTRRWLITLNPTVQTPGGPVTVNGARRVTVRVTLNAQSSGNAVAFQMSMVRP
jgi:Tfp pilus assembly protein PilV